MIFRIGTVPVLIICVLAMMAAASAGSPSMKCSAGGRSPIDLAFLYDTGADSAW